MGQRFERCALRISSLLKFLIHIWKMHCQLLQCGLGCNLHLSYLNLIPFRMLLLVVTMYLTNQCSLRCLWKLEIYQLWIPFGNWGTVILESSSKVFYMLWLVRGVVTIRSEVFSQLKKIMYKCVKCGVLKGPFYINSINDVRLGQCSSCQSTGPFPIDKQKTIYRNYQKITMQ